MNHAIAIKRLRTKREFPMVVVLMTFAGGYIAAFIGASIMHLVTAYRMNRETI